MKKEGKDARDKDRHDDGQRGDRVRESDEFNGDPETLRDSCDDAVGSVKEERKPSEPREYRQGMKYDKDVRTRIYTMTWTLPEDSID